MQAVISAMAIAQDMAQTGSRSVKSRQGDEGFQSLLENHLGGPLRNTKTPPVNKQSNQPPPEPDSVTAAEAAMTQVIAQPRADTAEETTQQTIAGIAQPEQETQTEFHQAAQTDQETSGISADDGEQDESTAAAQRRQGNADARETRVTGESGRNQNTRETQETGESGRNQNTRATRIAGESGSETPETPDDADEQDESAVTAQQRQNARGRNNRNTGGEGGANNRGIRMTGGDEAETRGRSGRTNRAEETVVRNPQDRQRHGSGIIRQDRFTRMLERAENDLNARGARANRTRAEESIGRTIVRESGAALTRNTEQPAGTLTRQATGAEFNRVLQQQSQIRRQEPEPQNNIQAETRPREPAPVTVQQPAATTQPQQNQQPTQAQQVEARIVENLQNPDTPMRSEFEMTLTPQELGRVNVRMMLENGRLAVEIVTVSGRAEEVLRAQINALTTALKSTMPDLHTISIVTSTQAMQSSLYGSGTPNDFMHDTNENARESADNGAKNGRGGKGGAEGGGDDGAEPSGRNKKSPHQLLDYSI
jgi:flagellar hook-length control protein FliK